MKPYRYIFAAVGILMCVNMFALRQSPRPEDIQRRPPVVQQAPQGDDKTIIDIKGRSMSPIKIEQDSVTIEAVSLVGNVIAYHNGSVITCDSAVRYSNRRIECFGNVIINKDTTYVYGDRVDYDGDRNLARVYSPLIKMIDGEAVLYTYNFIFNTLENIGEYFGGGTVTRGETLLESDRGFYYADTKDVICIGNAELRDTAYQIMSDSMGFNMDTEIATFYTDTKIWNQKGEILSADRGWYYTKDEHYHFIENAYILTADQEVWADDINYWSLVEDAVLRNNIQIRDEEQELLSFGDYGIYFGESGDAMLTENPSLISFADENGDSLYMRSDTMFMYMIDTTSIYHPDYVGKKKADSGVVDEVLIDPANEMLNRQAQLSSLIDKAAQGGGITAADSVALGLASGGLVETMGPMPVTDSLAQGNIPPGAISANEVDSVSVDNIISGTVSDESLQAPIKEPTKKELRQQLKEAKRLAKEAKRKEKEAVKQAKAAAKRAKRGKPITSPDNAEEAGEEAAEEPGMGDNIVDPEEEMTEPETEEEEKEKDRVLIAYYNVKMWRTDFQAVCDSMLAFSIDTTMHMYIDPVMWNGENQITSDLAVIHTVNEQLDKAVFTGSQNDNPIMSSKLDNWHYNQVTGKVIEALFKDNEIYRNDVVGNGQTYYYLQDEETGEYQGFLVVECADMTFHIKDRDVETIVYRSEPVFAIYPMDKIPATQEQTLPNFKWVGERRPEKEEVFNRVIRPSMREQYEALQPPQFPLTDKINAYKSSLIKSGTWRDRDEDISQEAYDYIRRLESQKPLQ